MSARASRTRSLWPREHGAYVQFLVPLVTALVATHPTVAEAAIALGASLAFLASEPLRVVLGDRGPRMQGPRARRRLTLLAATAMIAGGTGLALAPRSAIVLACFIAPPIALVIFLSRRRTVHNVFGESIAAVALAGAAAPVAVAGGMAAADALVRWWAWSSGYALTVIAVHHVIARHRRAMSLDDVPRMISALLICAALVALVAVHPAARFAVPLAAVAALVLIRPPRATRIRAVGIAFLVGSVVSSAYAVTAVWG